MAEEDPVAEFLAREKDDLAGLVDDTSLPIPISDDTTAPIDNGFVDNLSGDLGGLDIQSGEADFLSGGGGGEADFLSGGGGDGDFFNQPAQPVIEEQPEEMPLKATVFASPKVEPETIRKWREDQKIRLEKKDLEEDKKKQEWHDQAKKELEEWYKQRSEQMEKTRKNNRVAEEEFVRDRDADLPGQEWERITRLCEFTPKAGKNAKDVSRLRGLLLQLKAQETK